MDNTTVYIERDFHGGPAFSDRFVFDVVPATAHCFAPEVRDGPVEWAMIIIGVVPLSEGLVTSVMPVSLAGTERLSAGEALAS